ncbi:flagellar brake protein [Roseateles violae]|uniref:Flagellar brake protein n=1 Tax=Roseateles violae TaxID=3058042 RepID=A0ABT8DN13_9BURK|nr:flagellar brake protein [Pelomonas sp. PFR6]MDN3919775.1 flagellar brake protein [Pelomonas sp. PFR6]
MASETVPTTPPSPSDSAGLGAFRLNAPSEVQALLQRLRDERVTILLDRSGHADNGAGLSAKLDAFDAAALRLQLDARAGDPRLALLLDGPAINAAAYLDRIRLQFELRAPRLLGDGCSLGAALPAELYRIQRRDAFRVRPHSRTPQVRLRDAAPHEPIALRVLDLSIGGMALQLPPEMRLDWPLGASREVQVELDRDCLFAARLRLQHQRPLGEAGSQLGCAFAGLEPAALRQLQYFIDQTQKLDRLLRSPGRAE